MISTSLCRDISQILGTKLLTCFCAAQLYWSMSVVIYIITMINGNAILSIYLHSRHSGPGDCMWDYKNPQHLDVVDRCQRRMGDYKKPLHLDVVDRYLRRMGDKTIPDEAPPSFIPHESQVSINHNQGVVEFLSRSPINTNAGVF